MIERRESARGELETLLNKLKAIVADEELSDKEQQALFMLMQYETFGFFGDASLGEIAEHLQRGEQRTRQYMKALEAKGLVKRIRKRSPVTFALTDSFKRRYAVGPP